MRVGKLDRYRQLKELQNVIEPACKDLLAAPFRMSGNWNNEFFQRPGDVILEIGCGWGDYTLHLARQHPESNILGLDVKGARIWRGARQALRERVTNAGFVRVSADFVDRLFAPQEVAEIWLTFPTPSLWKPERMLIAPSFLTKYRRILRPSGVVHLKTDVEPLADYACRIWPLFGFTMHTGKDSGSAFTHHAREAISRFESRAVQSQRPIWHIQASVSSAVPNKEIPDDLARHPWDFVYRKS